MFEAPDEATLLMNLERLIAEESLDVIGGLLAALAEGKTEYSDEECVVTLTGRKRNVIFFFQVMPGYEESLGKVIVSLVDITERKRAELELQRLNESLEQQVSERIAELKGAAKDQALLAALVESTSAAVVSFQMDGTIGHWNPMAERLFGYPVNEALGQNIRILFEAERQGEFDETLAGLKQGEPVQDFETVLLHRNGTQIDVALTVSLIKDEQGNVTGMSGIARDISERKLWEHQVVEQGERERRRIGQDLHDGLCQQLSAMEFLSGALEQKLSKAGDANAAEARKIVDLASQSVEQARQIAHGLSPVVATSHGLMQALQELTDQTQLTYNITCQFHCPKPVPVDEDLLALDLYRIAQEGVTNAVKHGKPGKIQIELKETQTHFILVVRDNGHGITEAAISRSLGMGLRSMRNRANMMHGVLDVHPGSRRGTTVKCSVPKNSLGQPAIDTTP